MSYSLSSPLSPVLRSDPSSRRFGSRFASSDLASSCFSRSSNPDFSWRSFRSAPPDSGRLLGMACEGFEPICPHDEGAASQGHELCRDVAVTGTLAELGQSPRSSRPFESPVRVARPNSLVRVTSFESPRSSRLSLGYARGQAIRSAIRARPSVTDPIASSQIGCRDTGRSLSAPIIASSPKGSGRVPPRTIDARHGGEEAR